MLFIIIFIHLFIYLFRLQKKQVVAKLIQLIVDCCFPGKHTDLFTCCNCCVSGLIRQQQPGLSALHNETRDTATHSNKQLRWLQEEQQKTREEAEEVCLLR